MSKLILCLFLLFNIYICEEPKNIKVFEYNYGKDNLIKIRTDEEFKIKLYEARPRTPWILFNKNETQKYLQLLKNYKGCEGRPHSAAGIRCYAYFHFKALKKTKEDKFLIYSLGNNGQSFKIFKINIE